MHRRGVHPTRRESERLTSPDVALTDRGKVTHHAFGTLPLPLYPHVPVFRTSTLSHTTNSVRRRSRSSQGHGRRIWPPWPCRLRPSARWPEPPRRPRPRRPLHRPTRPGPDSCSTPRSSREQPPRMARATGWSAPTAASSPSGRRLLRLDRWASHLNSPIVGLDGHVRRARLLGGGRRRWCLRLRRRRLPRVDRQQRARRPHRRLGPHRRQRRLLVGRCRRRRLRLRRRRLLRLGHRHVAHQPDHRHRPDLERPRLLGGGGRRQHLRLRRRQIRRHRPGDHTGGRHPQRQRRVPGRLS